ncbi:MAG: TRAP transporter substrate-binding protein [Burkholderiales bacterium]|nr:TRAP transporter substrate-binding protein [Burkholderiales bacterium]
MTRRFVPRTLAAVVAAALVAGAGAVAAQQKPVSLRYASGAPPKTPWVTQIERFQKYVDEESKGAVKVEAFIAAQLGNEQDTIQQLARGRIDMGGFASGAMALVVPEVANLILPFYFRTIAESDCTIDALTPQITALLARKGVQLLGFTDIGTIDIVGKKPYVLPADVKGVKAVAYSSKMYTVFWNALGANSSPLGITEWAPAFQSGAVDLTGTPATFYVPSGLNKIAPVLTRLDMWSSPAFVIMNKGIFDRLSKDQQDAIMRAAARDSTANQRKEARAFEAMIRGVHEKGGGQVVQVTPAQREEWRKVVAPAWPQMVKEIGGESESFFRQIESARKGCEGRS